MNESVQSTKIEGTQATFVDVIESKVIGFTRGSKLHRSFRDWKGTVKNNSYKNKTFQ